MSKILLFLFQLGAVISVEFMLIEVGLCRLSYAGEYDENESRSV